jgi:hypothetical protein
MPLSFLSFLKWFIAVVSVLLLSGLAISTAQGQTLLTGGGAAQNSSATDLDSCHNAVLRI